VLEEFRKSCDVLVALGDCAISGGIPAMRNNVPLRECLEQAYLGAPGLWNPAAVIPNDPELPLLLNRIYPCSEVVKVDVSIPGCPPAEAIGQALTAALAGRPIQLEYGVLKYD